MVSVNTLIGVSTIVFGFASLLLISKARSKLSPGSIREYVDNFSICLAFILIFSIWQTFRSIYGREISVSDFSSYPELIFVGFAYIGFILVSYRVFKISKEFGFKSVGGEIGRLVKVKKKK